MQMFVWRFQKCTTRSVFLCVFTPLSLRQMEQNRIDLKKIEEETKGKVAAVNSQKVTIVKDIVASTKVSRRCYFLQFTLQQLQVHTLWDSAPLLSLS